MAAAALPACFDVPAMGIDCCIWCHILSCIWCTQLVVDATGDTCLHKQTQSQSHLHHTLLEAACMQERGWCSNNSNSTAHAHVGMR
jgi:hypothetical protein